MALGRAAAVAAALASRAASIAMHSVQTPTLSTDTRRLEDPANRMKAAAEIARRLARDVAQLEDPTERLGEVENVSMRVSKSGPKENRTAFQWSEKRLGPPWLESKACSIAWNSDAPFSAWQEQDPPVFPEAGIGARRRMYPMEDMDYQLFLPRHWSNNSLYPYPVVIYLHSQAERKWAVMNSGSLPRLLARNQSTSFDNRSCWCLNSSFEQVELFQESRANASEAYDTSAAPSTVEPTRADCTFADTFRGIVIMPQGWTKNEYAGWTADRFDKVTAITRAVMTWFNGDADRVIVTGMAEGAKGALKYASTTGSGLVASVIVADAPNATFNGSGLDGVPVMVSGDEAAGVAGLDDLVLSLKGRTSGTAFTRYRRYATAPGPADPSGGGRYNRSSDILYRDQTLWSWAFSKRIKGGRGKWDLAELDYVAVGGDHHSQPRRPDDAVEPQQPDHQKPKKPTKSYKHPNYHW
jgi:hypothetical protein